jgi:hypothetical protein
MRAWLLSTAAGKVTRLGISALTALNGRRVSLSHSGRRRARERCVTNASQSVLAASATEPFTHLPRIARSVRVPGILHREFRWRVVQFQTRIGGTVRAASQGSSHRNARSNLRPCAADISYARSFLNQTRPVRPDLGENKPHYAGLYFTSALKSKRGKRGPGVASLAFRISRTHLAQNLR